MNLENIINLAKRINAPILADNLSQLRFSKYSKNVNVYYDLYINAIVNKPDLILRFGDKPVSKNLNKFIDLNKKITHLIYPFGLFNDDCKKIIILDDDNLNKIEISSTENKFEIIIIENSLDMLLKKKLESKYNNLEVFVPEKNLGFAKAVNLGIKKAKK